MPNLLKQATESPPPINENAPFLVAFAIAREPAVKLSNSKTPAGPETQKAFAAAIEDAKTILWNGPAGVF